MKAVFVGIALIAGIRASMAQSCPCPCSTSTITLSNPTADAIGATTVALSWAAGTYSNYEIQYRESGIGPYQVNSITASKSGTATGLVAGHTYDFVVVGKRHCECDSCPDVNVSRSSNELIGITMEPPAPSGLTPDNPLITTSSIALTWTAALGTTVYEVDYSTNGFTSFNTVNAFSLSFEISGLLAGTDYSVRVRALNANGTSPNSASINISTLFEKVTAQAATAVTTTSFTTHWTAATSATASTRYQLEISLNSGFNPSLKTFTNLNTTSLALPFLGEPVINAGVTYFYRVRVTDAGGNSSDPSNRVTVVAIPPIPIITASTSITTTSFRVNWNAFTSAQEYRVDVASDNGFTNILPGFDNIVINGGTTFKVVGGLQPGTTYYYRVRTVAAGGTSANSTTGTVITLTDKPEIETATAITDNSFVAHWSRPVGTASFLIDVATDQQFTQILNGYSNLAVDQNSSTINSLIANTIYYYRVRAVNASGSSQSSTVVSQLILPPPPAQLAISDVTSTSFKLRWQSVPGTVQYEMQVSRSLEFDDPLDGYNPKVIPSQINEVVINQGITPSTVYYVRIVTRNATGSSNWSEIKTISTLSPSGVDEFAIKINSVTFPVFLKAGESDQIHANVSGGATTPDVKLFHRKKSEQAYSEEPFALAGTYFVTIQPSWFDDLGMEFYVEATDDTHSVRDVGHSIAVGVDGVTIPINSFGKDPGNYQIIAIPYSLSANSIAEIFEPVSGLGGYDKKRWRLIQYRDGKNIDYANGLSVSKPERGQGYWFISKDSVDLSFGPGYSYDDSFDRPFRMSLKRGWNQVGNPFPFVVSWTVVKGSSLNKSANVGTILLYDQSAQSLVPSEALKPFEGGFVFADADTDLFFPVTLAAPSGRISAPDEAIQNSKRWNLPITIRQGPTETRISGIGMNPNARRGKDQWDICTPPSIVTTIEFNSVDEDYDYKISTSIVNPQPVYRWSYTLTAGNGQPVTLKWDKSKAVAVEGQLVIHDLSANIIIDMASTDSYEAKPSSSFMIYYDVEKEWQAGQLQLGQPYPNPFQSLITIPYAYIFDKGELAQVQLIISTADGREVARLNGRNNGSAKIASIEWNGVGSDNQTISPGLYFYQLNVVQKGRTSGYHGKFVKQ
jgi:hypothetical protein